ncbi:MAG: Lrp/AsnC ligand binding domain-containing protein [Candidatus Bathyarchaeia archaeon]
MSSKAYVLISAELDTEKQVVENLEAIPEVKEAWAVYGVYDVVALVESEGGRDALKDVIFSKIRNMENVRATITMIVM